MVHQVRTELLLLLKATFAASTSTAHGVSPSRDLYPGCTRNRQTPQVSHALHSLSGLRPVPALLAVPNRAITAGFRRESQRCE